MIEVWFPANRVERKLAWALSTGDLTRFFRLLATADLFQPLGDRGGTGPEGRHYITLPLDGTTILPVYTSYEVMEEALGDTIDAAILTDYSQLRASWPDPDWLLGVDPGLPIEAYLPVDAVEQGRRGELAPADPEVLIGRLGNGDWEPWPDGPNAAVLSAVSIGDAAEYLDALLDSMVTVAVSRPVTEPLALLGPDFPWRPIATSPEPTIDIFTDESAFAAAHPGRQRLTIRFLMLLYHWPAGHTMAVNPGGPAGLDLAAVDVPRLLEWVRAGARDGIDARIPQQLLMGMRWAQERDWPQVRIQSGGADAPAENGE